MVVYSYKSLAVLLLKCRDGGSDFLLFLFSFRYVLSYITCWKCKHITENTELLNHGRCGYLHIIRINKKKKKRIMGSCVFHLREITSQQWTIPRISRLSWKCGFSVATTLIFWRGKASCATMISVLLVLASCSHRAYRLALPIVITKPASCPSQPRESRPHVKREIDFFNVFFWQCALGKRGGKRKLTVYLCTA